MRALVKWSNFEDTRAACLQQWTRQETESKRSQRQQPRRRRVKLVAAFQIEENS